MHHVHIQLVIGEYNRGVDPNQYHPCFTTTLFLFGPWLLQNSGVGVERRSSQLSTGENDDF
jgi:hypothetical protein